MIKVSDFVADFLARQGITQVFTITGGGAMHLNMSLGRHKGLRCIYNHQEQACAVAAESYARKSGKMAAVCVTSGPGGTNAITGVLGAWLDSVPMLVISGQVRFDTTVRSTNLPLRQLGDQEFDITRCAASFTKYAEMVTDPKDIAFHLEKAVFLAASGRPGPCWIDIPLNIQGAFVEEKDLRHYTPNVKPVAFDKNAPRAILEKIAAARRPVLLAGEGITISGMREEFLLAVEKLGVPVVTAWNAQDLMADDHPLYCGRPSTVGDRAGNFIVQNSDCLLVLGCRLNIRQISYNWADFAHNAFKIMVDIDAAELAKPTLKTDMPVHADLRDFLPALNAAMPEKLPVKKAWLDWCAGLKKRYPVTLPSYWLKNSPVNPYCFVDALSDVMRADDTLVLANGSACVCGLQAVKIKKGQRVYTNSGCASMGYDLPAAIGAAAAGARRVICLAGDGSLQMNLQEMQTIAHNKMPVKLFVLNNNGYHSIRQTQANFFGGGFAGCGPESGVSFPDMEKIAAAYRADYFRVKNHKTLRAQISKTLEAEGFAVCEVMIDPAQPFAPKTSSKKLPDGKIVSAPLEDMWPFLERDEFEAVMKEGGSK